MNRKKSAITLVEVVIAVVILSIAVVPIFMLITNKTVETEKTAAEAFAINKASEVLSTILDSVPFATLRQGNPASISVKELPQNSKYSDYDRSWAKKISKVLFGHDNEEPVGFVCKGIAKDARGLQFIVHLRVEDVQARDVTNRRPETLQIGSAYPDSDPSEFPAPKEMVFSYLENPSILGSSKWAPDYAEKPIAGQSSLFTELDLPGSIANPPNNVYKDERLQEFCGSNPHLFMNPTASRYTAKKVIPVTDSSHSNCVMKKVTVQIQWNTGKGNTEKPETEDAGTQRIHLVALKADLD